MTNDINDFIEEQFNSLKLQFPNFSPYHYFDSDLLILFIIIPNIIASEPSYIKWEEDTFQLFIERFPLCNICFLY